MFDGFEFKRNHAEFIMALPAHIRVMAMDELCDKALNVEWNVNHVVRETDQGIIHELTDGEFIEIMGEFLSNVFIHEEVQKALGLKE